MPDRFTLTFIGLVQISSGFQPVTVHKPTLTSLNGVSGCTQWLRKTFPDAFWEVEQNAVAEVHCDHAYIDCNEFLHSVLKKARTPTELYKQTERKLQNYIFQLRPKRTLLIAADGPGPMAKILTQRRRRAKSSSKDAAKSTKSVSEPALSSAQLTPGTHVMVGLDRALHAYAQARLDKGHAHDRSLAITVSGPQVAGEGELKMLAALYRRGRRQRVTSSPAASIAPTSTSTAAAIRGKDDSVQQQQQQEDRRLQRGPSLRPTRSLSESHVFVGGDSDLLLMCLASGAVASPQAAAGAGSGGGGAGAAGAAGQGEGAARGPFSQQHQQHQQQRAATAVDASAHTVTVVSLKPPRDVYFASDRMARSLQRQLESVALGSVNKPPEALLPRSPAASALLGALAFSPSSPSPSPPSSSSSSSSTSSSSSGRGRQGPPPPSTRTTVTTTRRRKNSAPPPVIPVHEAALDLTLLFLLASGNDYLPLLRTTKTGSGVEPLWRAYLQVRQGLLFLAEQQEEEEQQQQHKLQERQQRGVGKVSAGGRGGGGGGTSSALAALLGPLVSAPEPGVPFDPASCNDSNKRRGKAKRGRSASSTVGPDTSPTAARSHVESGGRDSSHRSSSSPPPPPPPSSGLNLRLLALVLELAVEKTSKPTVASASRDLENVPAYLEALTWNMDMYLTGECPDYRLGFVPATSVSAVLEFCRNHHEQQQQRKEEEEEEEDEGLRRRRREGERRENQQREQQLLPPPPAIYNMLLQPKAGAPLVAPPLRSFMEDPESPVQWLFEHGCRCAECGSIHNAKRPLSQTISRVGGRIAQLKPRGRNKSKNKNNSQGALPPTPARLPQVGPKDANPNGDEGSGGEPSGGGTLAASSSSSSFAELQRLEEELEVAQQAMAKVVAWEARHEAEKHNGEHIHFNELPSNSELDAIISAFSQLRAPAAAAGTSAEAAPPLTAAPAAAHPPPPPPPPAAAAAAARAGMEFAEASRAVETVLARYARDASTVQDASTRAKEAALFCASSAAGSGRGTTTTAGGGGGRSRAESDPFYASNSASQQDAETRRSALPSPEAEAESSVRAPDWLDSWDAHPLDLAALGFEQPKTYRQKPRARRSRQQRPPPPRPRRS